MVAAGINTRSSLEIVCFAYCSFVKLEKIVLKSLIVNADDFGLHTAVNHAVINGYEKGCLRSTSLMPTGSAVEEAAALARQCPELGVGVHITLVAEYPVLPPERVRSLIGSDGRFFPDHVAFIKAFVQGKIRMAELYAECEAQIQRVKSLGIDISHLDSHQHLHVLPKIIDVCLELAKKYDIHRMRLPAEGCFFTGGYPAPLARKIARGGLSLCARLARQRAAGRMAMPDAFFGMLAGGHMEQKYFQAVLQALPEGVSEIMVHPGLDNAVLGAAYDWQYHWVDEYHAVTASAVLEYIRQSGIRLISFKELSDE